jgi:hypothetical protein
MVEGDLVIIIESFPDWHWLTYTTNDIGIIVKTRGRMATHSYPVCEVFFFHNKETHPVPLRFVRLLSEANESR